MREKIQFDIVIYPEEKDKCKIYSISSMQIPNVVTQGNTIEEAKLRLKEALELYFESAPWERERLKKIDKENQAPMISRIFL
ncbi:MAG: type II toxin-antitoxin system HicB family antitoxin [Nanoarchaeota archaeon]|nr:type II toxin-antitoxin system HicB family antitoxin [Nanoarchaeota archaeon]